MKKVFLVTYTDVNGDVDSSLFFCKDVNDLLDAYEFNGMIASYKYKEVTSALKAYNFVYQKQDLTNE